jgi:hypothetical protein
VKRGGGHVNDGGNDGYDNEGKQGNDNGELEEDGLNTDDNDCDNSDKVTNFSNHGMAARVDLNPPEAASTEVDEEKELMLLVAAEHIKMARA